MRVYSGKRILVTSNAFELSNSAGSSDVVTLFGIGEAAGTARYTDELRFVGNSAHATGAGARFWRFEARASDSGARFDFVSNWSDLSRTFSFATRPARANVHLQNTPADGLDPNQLIPPGPGAASQPSNVGP